MNSHRVPRARPGLVLPAELLDLDWDGSAWADVPALAIAQFLPASSSHRPHTELKLQHSLRGLHGLFRVRDRFVRCVHTQFQAPVYKDSCVELFLQPHPVQPPPGRSHASYLNLEIGAGGTLRCYHILDCTRTADGFREYVPLSATHGAAISTHSTLPRRILPEIDTALEWRLAFELPFAVMEHYLGPLRSPEGVSGQQWRGNAFKCAEDCSHPHWASWQSCSGHNFHLPADFGDLLFE